MTDSWAVPAPAWCSTSAWDPARRAKCRACKGLVAKGEVRVVTRAVTFKIETGNPGRQSELRCTV
eukprot:3398887-Prymnesium_polylepis.1